MQKLFVVLLMMLPFLGNADTIYVKKVKVPYNSIIDSRGKIKVWYKKVKVNQGYIIKESDCYVINDKRINFKYFKKPKS